MKKAPRPFQNQRLRKAKPRSQQVLEVSIRREKHREKKIQSVISTMAWVFLFSVLAAGAWVGTREGLRRYFWDNPGLYLTDVRVKSDGSLTREQIIQCGGIVEGSNIFTVSESQIRSSLQKLPQVEFVEVQRSIPHRLDVEVRERQPIAWLTEAAGVDPTVSDRSFLIDRRGFVMRPRKFQPEYLPLPIISGVELGNLVPGRKANQIQLDSALELLRLNSDNPHWQVKSIAVEKKYCLVVTDRTHAEYTFGLEDIERQLNKLNRLLEYLEPQHKELQTVNLLVKWNTPVTFADDPAAPPAATPAPLKPEDKAKAAAAAKKADAAKLAEPKKDVSPAATRKSSDTIHKPFRLHE